MKDNSEILIEALESIVEEKYPEHLFTGLTETEWKNIKSFLSKQEISLDRLSAYYGRIFQKIFIDQAKEALGNFKSQSLPISNVENRVYLARGCKYKLEGDDTMYDALQDEHGKYYYVKPVISNVDEAAEKFYPFENGKGGLVYTYNERMYYARQAFKEAVKWYAFQLNRNEK